MKTPKDRAEKLLEAIFSKVERIEGIVEKPLAASRSSTASQVSSSGLDLSEIKRQLVNIQESLDKPAKAEPATENHHYLWFFSGFERMVRYSSARQVCVAIYFAVTRVIGFYIPKISGV